MSRVRPWTNGDQVALNSGRVPVYQDEKEVQLYDSAGTPIVVDADGRIEVSVGDSTGAEWLLNNGGMPVNMRDGVGNPLASTDSALNTYVTDDFFLEVAKGNIPGHSIYRKFGRVSSIQIAAPADCWEYGITAGAEQYTWSTTAAIDSISSDNAGDTEEITVTMLDIDYVEFTQTVNLNGQTRVPLTPGFRFNRAYNSNGSPTLGNVYIYEDTPLAGGVPVIVTLVRGFISIGGQQTLQSVYTVPAGKDAYLYKLKTSMGGRKSGFATYEAFLRTVGSIFLIKDTHDLAATGTSTFLDPSVTASFFPEKTDFKPLVTVDTNGIGFSVSFVLVLVDI